MTDGSIHVITIISGIVMLIILGVLRSYLVNEEEEEEDSKTTRRHDAMEEKKLDDKYKGEAHHLFFPES